MKLFDLLIDFHKGAYRQGPGSPEETRKAIYLLGIDNQTDLSIADIGCGTGAQTMILATQLQGQITAVDLSPIFLDELNQRAHKNGVAHKIQTLVCAMDDLPFQEEQFDLIWSEGAAYNMGFQQAIRYWKHFLKKGGFMALSEISWLTHNRPEALTQYWTNAYPQIDTVSNKIRVLEENGYTPIGHFILPEHCWIEHYYQPMISRFNMFLEQYDHAPFVVDFIQSEKEEIIQYERYKEYFGYGFYLVKK
ncbi:MAG: methyltransferase domain-containing protein [Bacteroidetes Order II. Incertae sedis bacterium]|nr:methyltransferase domain-containing protein [Bacteroidetes Order II. bacterium]